ncbi:hypothetical protein O0L34_g14887 [Tuta absoluta]|nr:hypothetical protein O0L34_g14887 [Tuta absoluta]
MAERQFTRQEVASHYNREDAHIIIDNVVYDVSKFIEEHPGGGEVLVDNAGRDASQCFHDIGHSQDAVEWRKQFRVGEVVPEERREVIKKRTTFGGGTEPITLGGIITAVGPPAILAFTAFILYAYIF